MWKNMPLIFIDGELWCGRRGYDLVTQSLSSKLFVNILRFVALDCPSPVLSMCTLSFCLPLMWLCKVGFIIIYLFQSLYERVGRVLYCANPLRFTTKAVQTQYSRLRALWMKMQFSNPLRKMCDYCTRLY